jgi:hypothetical protein
VDVDQGRQRDAEGFGEPAQAGHVDAVPAGLEDRDEAAGQLCSLGQLGLRQVLVPAVEPDPAAPAR